ncbi:SAM-dependent methyltransferase [Actinocrinis puniceicyclus]|uniref:SAM-dependent methyltransferase n=1 Tax=Actinocrinis puniceicyclus TaxID=977794 RepID=A0A8J7WMU5_9ACTN|nr:SAM-dependent methyltransferase [Actinocrinis puniceicyclus]MBS2965276.1 SAM-dependent methyltransferase [Actinocrinis puniceicyclus]
MGEGSMQFDPDVTVASPSRVYDYWLGGSFNFAVDRELGDRMIAIDPTIVPMVRDNRSFLRRAVTWLCEHDVTQFLDLGSGIPTVGNVHEVAARLRPEAKVAYVDCEPVAVTMSTRLLEGNPNATITHADLRDWQTVLAAPTVAGLLDFNRPIAVLALSVLQYFDEAANPAETIAHYRRALVPGSYLGITHISADEAGVDMVGLAEATRKAAVSAHLRTREQVMRLFGDAQLVPPGLVRVGEWNPQPGAPAAVPGIFGGLGRVP